MKAEINQLFHEIYGYAAEKAYFSPGRVNIIGGHTDYNGGAVLPFCINMGIYGAISYRKDQLVRIYSGNLDEIGIISFDLNDLSYDETRDFGNYASGVLLKLIENGYSINNGFDMAIIGNLPKGGGLSSSAALSVLIATAVKEMAGLDLNGVHLAKICKRVENEYIGVNCGIMDQFIIANGKKDHAMYLESSSLYFEHITCVMDDYKFVLVNSNTTRKLIESKYNTRQSETQQVLKTLQQYVKIDYICDLDPSDYDIYKDKIDSDDLRKRFKHLVNEHARVKQSKIALINKDFITLGQLLNQAHESASKLYEVSSDILDQLVRLALESGSVGSKMIGGGFGGSTLNLVKADEIESFIERFTNKYTKIYKKEPIIHVVDVMGGVSRI